MYDLIRYPIKKLHVNECWSGFASIVDNGPSCPGHKIYGKSLVPRSR